MDLHSYLDFVTILNKFAYLVIVLKTKLMRILIRTYWMVLKTITKYANLLRIVTKSRYEWRSIRSNNFTDN